MTRQICSPTHKHDATATCYSQHRCGCSPCRDANNARAARRRRLIAYGSYDAVLTSAAPARAHLFALKVADPSLTIRAIAQTTGVATTTLFGILNRDVLQIRKNTAQRICAVTPATLPATSRTFSRSAQRRIQALAARGWSIPSLARQLNVAAARLYAVLARDFVPTELHDAICELYEHLWDTAPPSSTAYERRARTRALHTANDHGWVPPLAWDDIDTDLEPATPDADPDLIDDLAITLALAGEPVVLTAREIEVAVARGTDQGLSAAELSPLLGVVSRTVQRSRRRQRRAEVAA